MGFGKYIFTTLIVVVLLCGVTGCVSSDHPSHEESTFVNIGDIAPDFTVQLIDGGTRSLSSLRGEVVMLILFSSSCPDCQAQFTELSRLIQHERPSFRLLAISRGESVEETTEFRDQYAFPYEMGVDPGRSIYNRYASMYIPRTYLIDRTGEVVALTVEFEADELQSIWRQATEMTTQNKL